MEVLVCERKAVWKGALNGLRQATTKQAYSRKTAGRVVLHGFRILENETVI